MPLGLLCDLVTGQAGVGERGAGLYPRQAGASSSYKYDQPRQLPKAVILIAPSSPAHHQLTRSSWA